MRDLELAVLWQAIWLAAAAATVPWLRWLHLPARPAQGIALAAGPALVVLPLWWVGMLSGIPFTRATLFLVSSLLALVGWGLVIARGQSWQSLTEIIRAWPLLLVHTGAFALYALFRSYNPAIRYTEKPMELAFLSAAWANPHLPPPDPWFAGRPINYYTFGYVEFGAIAKTLGCQPEFAFNLALASLFASAVTAAYVATWLLATRYGAKARVLAGVTRTLSPRRYRELADGMAPSARSSWRTRCIMVGWTGMASFSGHRGQRLSVGQYTAPDDQRIPILFLCPG
jgi:uncharacterized membrane protein